MFGSTKKSNQEQLSDCKTGTLTLLACLHYQNKIVAFFWRAGLFSANQDFLKTFQIALIGWIKAGPPKKPLLF